MDHNSRQDIALMRYAAIAPAVSGLLEDYPTMTAFYQDASKKGVTAPDGTVKHFAPTTIQRWYLDYKQGGFDALLPRGRVDEGIPRKLDPDLQDQIIYLKEHFPRMSAAAIFRQLQDNGSIRRGETSQSTVTRFIRRLSAETQTEGKQEMRRYERPHINEVWCGDSCTGPYLAAEDGKKHRVHIIALIDDASRFIVGADVFFNDNFVNLMSVMKSAVSKYGRPQLFNFDNGGPYKNGQMHLLAARIGSSVHYDQPYTPTQKAKIERWFRTLRDQWMASLDMGDFRSLDELRGSLAAYVQKYNLSPHGSLKGVSPHDRFFSEPDHIRRLSDEAIQHSFLLELERRVSADGVIVIDNTEYEVDFRFAKQRIRLRHSPDMQTVFIVEHDGTLTPLRLLNKQENAQARREKVRLCKGDTA